MSKTQLYREYNKVLPNVFIKKTIEQYFESAEGFCKDLQYTSGFYNRGLL